MDYPDRTHNRGHDLTEAVEAPATSPVPADDRAQHALLVGTTSSPGGERAGIDPAGGRVHSADAGLDQYEVSAFSREGEEPGNMNYWRFGDYIDWVALMARSLCPTVPILEPNAPGTHRLSCRDDVIAPVTAAGCRDFACGEDCGIRYE